MGLSLQADTSLPTLFDTPVTPITKKNQSSTTESGSAPLSPLPLGENTTPASSVYTDAEDNSPATAISKENEPEEDVRQCTTGQSRQARKGTGLRNYPRKVAPGVKAMQAAADSRYFTELRQHFNEVLLFHKCWQRKNIAKFIMILRITRFIERMMNVGRFNNDTIHGHQLLK